MKLSSLPGVVFIFWVHTAFAQFAGFESKFDSSEKYLFPIKPGMPGTLAGTMGELRSTHFHSGIDIHVNIGCPVLAAKSGYISRAGVSGYGYGNVLYINHPDGTTTLYGHLDRFHGAASDYILKERYRRKTSDIELYFRENQFKVKQGDTIAYSGNSGGSEGPHLHFNIQRNNIALDPLKFAFNEIHDNISPTVQKIALVTLDPDSRINDQFGRFEFYVARIGTNYSLPVPILASGNIGVELLGFDRLENVHYRCGINYIEMFLDDQKIFNQQIEEVNTNDSRGIYGLMDFKTMRTQGNKFYKLYIDDSNYLNFYKASPTNGKIKINPGMTSSVKIIAKDIFGNASEVTFKLQPSEPIKEVIFLDAIKKPVSYDLQENTLTISTQSCPGNSVYYKKGVATSMEPTYSNSKKKVYLFDLRKIIPDSINVCGQSLVPNIKVTVPSGIEYKYYSDPINVQIPKGALFDTLYMSANHQIGLDSTEVFTIGSPLIPLKRNITISLKPSLKYSTSKNVAVYRMAGNGFINEGGRWLNGQMQFNTRELGNFTIKADTIPPTIGVIYCNNQSARFKIRDNLSGIESFEATINGQWLLMNYDAKNSVIMSERYNKKEQLRGDFELTVTDYAGNKKIYKQKIL